MSILPPDDAPAMLTVSATEQWAIRPRYDRAFVLDRLVAEAGVLPGQPFPPGVYRDLCNAAVAQFLTPEQQAAFETWGPQRQAACVAFLLQVWNDMRQGGPAPVSVERWATACEDAYTALGRHDAATAAEVLGRVLAEGGDGSDPTRAHTGSPSPGGSSPPWRLGGRRGSSTDAPGPSPSTTPTGSCS